MGDLKKCPKCSRWSVSLDYNRGLEICRWRDCNWVNTERRELPVAYKTDITSGKGGVIEEGNS